jgi:hypothetical protein
VHGGGGWGGVGVGGGGVSKITQNSATKFWLRPLSIKIFEKIKFAK